MLVQNLKDMSICCLFIIYTLLYFLSYARTEDSTEIMNADTRFRLVKRQVPYGFPASFQPAPVSHFGMTGLSMTPRNDVESAVMGKLDALMQQKMLEKFNVEMEARLKEFNVADNNSKNNGKDQISPNSGALGTTLFVGNDRSMAGQAASDTSGAFTTRQRAASRQPTTVQENPMPSSSKNNFDHTNQKLTHPAISSTNITPTNGWNRQGRSDQSRLSSMRQPHSFYDKGRHVAAKFGFLYPETIIRTGPKTPEKRVSILSSVSPQNLQGRSEPSSARSGTKGQRTRFLYL